MDTTLNATYDEGIYPNNEQNKRQVNSISPTERNSHPQYIPDHI